MSDEHFSCDRSAFTLALTEQLRTWAIRLDPHSIAELQSDGFACYSNPENEVDATYPSLFYMKVGEPTLPSIFLSPLHKSGPLRNGLSYRKSLWFSIRLADDQADVDSLNRWLLLKSEGITVDGPFRTPSVMGRLFLDENLCKFWQVAIYHSFLASCIQHIPVDIQ